jgi:probable phosphoglycerate mutase
MLPPVDLLMIRHGLPVRRETTDGSPADPELDAAGQDQAQRLARWLEPEGIDAVYVSPMRRALETAAPLAAALGVEPVVDDEIAEFDRASHFYIPIEELKATNDPRYEEMMRGEYSGEVDPETFRQVVVVAVERIVEANPGRRVAVVCHGGVINAWASHVLRIPEVLFFEPTYTSVSRFACSSRGHRTMVSLNETGHLLAERVASA